MPVQQMKAGSSISPISPLKLVAMATSLERSQNECWNNHPLYSIATNPENLVKIDPVSTCWDNIFGRIYICQLSPYRNKSFNFSPRNLRGYWTKSRQMYRHCRKSLPRNIFKSELRSSNSFQNASATNQGGVSQVYFCPQKLVGYHRNVS